MKQGKWCLSVLLALAMCLALLPAGVLADDGAAEEEILAEEPAAAAEESAEAVEETQAAVVAVVAETAESGIMTASDDGLAASGICGENLTWTLDEDGVLTISGTGEMYGYDGNTPWNCDSITKVVIENGVTSIGSGAFNCANLTSVTIPDSVTSIGTLAFYNCASLTSVIIPDSVTSIGAYAFYNCASLTSVTIPDSVTNIGASAFCGCTSLASVTIPDSIAYLADVVFGSCESLSSITIPASVTSIGSGTFASCTGLTSVIIPDSVTSIGAYVFNGCTNLVSVTIPDGVTSLWGFTFAECESLVSMTIPDSVTSIADYAFSNCTSLTSIIFEGDAPELDGSYIFYNVTATAYYYDDANGWTEEVMKSYDYGGDITWVAMSKSLTDEDGTVTVRKADGAVWTGVSLVVEEIEEEAVQSAMEPVNTEKYTAYDIYLKNTDGETIELTDKVTVTIAVPEGYDGAVCVVYHVAEDGALTDMNAAYDGDSNTLAFTTEHFSTYAVAQLAETTAETPAPSSSVQPAETPEPSPAGEPTASPETSATAKPGSAGNDGSNGSGSGAGSGKKSPGTGDEANLALWAAVLSLCGGGVCGLLAVWKKKNQ